MMARDYATICHACGRGILPDEDEHLVGLHSQEFCCDCYSYEKHGVSHVFKAVDTPTSRAMRRLAGIQRYEMEDQSRCWESWQDLEEHPAGEWVKYDDVVARIVEQEEAE